MATTNTNWRALISKEMNNRADSFDCAIACTMDDAGLDLKFNPGYGGTEGAPFTLWTASRVYFPICYNGCEWVGSAPRNPSDEALGHQGGG